MGVTDSCDSVFLESLIPKKPLWIYLQQNRVLFLLLQNILYLFKILLFQ